MAKIGFSKSKYCRGVQCPKILWLEKNMPEEAEEQDNEALLVRGNEVGDLAMGLFGAYTEVPYNHEDYPGMMELTEKLIKDNVENICEATFSYEGCFCAVDILKNLGNKQVEIYEVKSSADVKDYHILDISYQYYVLTKIGFKVKKVSIVHINSGYLRIGELEIEKLFTIKDLTEEAKSHFYEVEAKIAELREYLSQTEEPVCIPGDQCSNPFECPYYEYCSKYLEESEKGWTVDDIAGMRTAQKKKLREQGLVTFKQLYEANVLKGKYLQQVEVELKDLPPQIKREEIENFLSGLSYPLFFLDFEGYAPAIPPYDYTQPYHQIPFQYSLHYIEKKGGDLKHKEFLAYPGGDPRIALAKQLCEDIPMNVCVTVYHKGYECTRLKELASLYPDLKEHLLNICNNVMDLEVPFRNRIYYTKEMNGKSTIKLVLPALYPVDSDLDYNKLEAVHNGVEASETFERMSKMDKEELEKYRGYLLKYCGLDTLAMVKIWEKLKEAVE